MSGVKLPFGLTTRISGAALLVVLVMTVPFIVELRTVLAFFEINMGQTETLLTTIILVGLILMATIKPMDDGHPETNTNDNTS